MAVDGDIPARSFARHLEPWTMIAWLLPFAVVALAPLPTGDLAYQVRAGRLMLSSHEILRHDVFTYTFAGQTWVDQQWGAQLLFGAIYSAVGWRGSVILRALIVSLAVGLTFQRTRTNGADPLVAGGLSIGAFIVAMLVPGTVVLRPQLLAVLLFISAAWILQTRAEHRSRLWLLPLTGIVWANVHGSFVLLPLLVLTAAIDDVALRQPTRRATVALTVICALTPLVNPWGGGIYPYVAHLTTSHTIRTAVEEWQPLYVRWQTGVVFASATALVLFLMFRHASRRPTPGEVFGGLAFTTLALLSGRNIIWWALYLPPVAGALLVGWHPGADPPDDRAGLVVGSILTLVAIVAVVRLSTTQPATALLTEAPPGVTSAVEEATAGGHRLFNGSWGSWFEFALPDVPVFIDARGELTPDAVYRDYSVVMAGQSGWEDVLNRWKVDVVAVPADDHELTSVLDADPGWVATYRDDDGAVFTRTG